MKIKEEITATLPHWNIEGNYIRRIIQLKDFKEALSLINKIGEEAERIQHHPEWTNIYNQLDIKLSTHDAGKVTEKDIELAKFIDQLLKV